MKKGSVVKDSKIENFLNEVDKIIIFVISLYLSSMLIPVYFHDLMQQFIR